MSRRPDPARRVLDCLLGLLLIGGLAFAAAVEEWQVPPEDAARESSVASSVESRARGKEIYLELCAPCHSEDGGGDPEMEEALEAEVGDLSPSGDLTGRSDGELHWRIRNGSDLMPAFEGPIEDEQLWDLINYVRWLGDPSAGTPEG